MGVEMKKASKVMYLIAIVLNCLNFLVAIGMFGGAYIMKRYPGEVANVASRYGIEELNTMAKVLHWVTPVIVAAVVTLVMSIVLLIFGIRGLKLLEKNEQNSTPHIVMIVLGTLGGELFYLLAGIFGLVNASQSRHPQTPNIEGEKT